MHNDLSMLTVLTYAVDYLKVRSRTKMPKVCYTDRKASRVRKDPRRDILSSTKLSNDPNILICQVLGSDTAVLCTFPQLSCSVSSAPTSASHTLIVLCIHFCFNQVKNVIVCGHYECGGVRASMANNDHGLIENWIMGVKDVARIHSEELMVRRKACLTLFGKEYCCCFGTKSTRYSLSVPAWIN